MNAFIKQVMLISLLNLLSIQAFAAGLLSPVNGGKDLQITKHDVNVTVEEGFVITEVKQVFTNPSNQDIEARYSFPVPHHAAVGEFTYWIDGNPVHGEVLAKERAKQVYETEKAAGREAALVEKNSFKTFEILVSPVRANDNVKIKLVYLQKAHLDLGVGKYVYPLADGGTDDLASNFWSSNTTVEEQFSFNIKVRSAFPVETLRFPSHSNAKISQNTLGDWLGKLESQSIASEGSTQTQAAASLDKDIVVYWKHPSNLPATINLVPYKESAKDKGTFALTITPGDDLKPISRGKNWVFVLDTSGSMNGKLSTLGEGVIQAIDKLDSSHRVKIIAFNNHATDLSNGYLDLTPDNKKRISRLIGGLKAQGGTDLYAGLAKSTSGMDEDRTTAVILVTDGVANVGTLGKKSFYKLLDDNDIRLFTFIMGNSANEPLLSGMAKHSNGFAQSVSTSDDIIGQITWAMEKVKYEAFHDIKVEIDGVKTTDLSPEKLGTFYKGQQIKVFGHYWKEGPATVTVSGKVSGKEVTWKSTVNFPSVDTEHPEIDRLWAFAKIQAIEETMEKTGEADDHKKAIQDIAIDYDLVTDFTSMIVVREEIFQAMQIERNNKARITKEQKARGKRAPQVKTNKASPAPQTQRASFSGGSGGGSFGGLSILMLVSTLLIRRRM